MENRPFFDPYVTNGEINQQNTNANTNSNNNNFSSFKLNPNQMPNIPININEFPDINSGITSAAKFYEEQYMYYKYLTQVLEYKMKLMEYEKITRIERGNKNGVNVQK